MMVDGDILKKLEKTEESNLLLDLPGSIKPCVSLLLGTPISKGDVFSRNEYCYLIFTEFRRIGIKKDEARTKLGIWNSMNEPPLSETEVRGCLESAYRKSYTFGCNNQKLQDFCRKLGGKENCFYYKKISKDKRKNPEYDYTAYGWQKFLTSRESYILFYIIPYIEQKRAMSPGSRLYVACRELAETSGINQRYFSHDKGGKNILDRLKAAGLIEYSPGKKHKWNKTASSIRRVVPIPVPSDCKQGDKGNVNT